MFIAGWNLPGCIPEMEPALFETEEEAHAFIKEEKALAEECYSEWDATDPYVYWVEVAEDAEASA